MTLNQKETGITGGLRSEGNAQTELTSRKPRQLADYDAAWVLGIIGGVFSTEDFISGPYKFDEFTQFTKHIPETYSPASLTIINGEEPDVRATIFSNEEGGIDYLLLSDKGAPVVLEGGDAIIEKQQGYFEILSRVEKNRSGLKSSISYVSTKLGPGMFETSHGTVSLQRKREKRTETQNSAIKVWLGSHSPASKK